MKKKIIAELYIGHMKRYWSRVRLSKITEWFVIPVAVYDREKYPVYFSEKTIKHDRVRGFHFKVYGKPIELKTRIIQKYLLVVIK